MKRTVVFALLVVGSSVLWLAQKKPSTPVTDTSAAFAQPKGSLPARPAEKLQETRQAIETRLKENEKRIAEARAMLEREEALVEKVRELDAAYNEQRMSAEEYLAERKALISAAMD